MRPSVSVLATDGQSGASHLSTGAHLLFGTCHCGGCGFDLVVPVGPAGPVAGRVSACRDHWRLDNLGAPLLAVVDVEQPQNQLTVPGGHTGVVVPFELARIHDGERSLATVFGPEPSLLLRTVAPCPELPDARPSGDLDPHTTYFAVLVALCEPRLRPPVGPGSSMINPALPTSAEIARELAQRGLRITPRAVDAHIEYLIEKLGLRISVAAGGAKRSWRKEALAAAALRRRLVRPEHLPTQLVRQS